MRILPHLDAEGRPFRGDPAAEAARLVSEIVPVDFSTGTHEAFEAEPELWGGGELREIRLYATHRILRDRELVGRLFREKGLWCDLGCRPAPDQDLRAAIGFALFRSPDRVEGTIAIAPGDEEIIDAWIALALIRIGKTGGDFDRSPWSYLDSVALRSGKAAHRFVHRTDPSLVEIVPATDAWASRRR